MLSMNTHLKGVLVFIGVFDLGFIFIVEIWHDVHNGSGYTLISISCQTISVYPDSRDLVDLCPNLWCNNSKEIFFWGILFCGFKFSFVFTKNACFFFAVCGNFATFCSLSLKKTVKTYMKSQVCSEFIIIILENNRLHKSDDDITLYNVAMKGFTLSSCILFELLLFVLLGQNYHPQLQCIYMFTPMIPI